MHGEHDVVVLRSSTTIGPAENLLEARHLGARPSELPTHANGEGATHQSPEQGAHEELLANHLVVLRPDVVAVELGRGEANGGHHDGQAEHDEPRSRRDIEVSCFHQVHCSSPRASARRVLALVLRCEGV